MALAALLIAPLRFGYFLDDYFTDYRLNAFGWFGGNLKGAVSEVVTLSAKQPVPAVYLSSNIGYASERWHFYLAADGREDLFGRTRAFDATVQMKNVPSGSLVIVRPEDGRVRDLRLTSPPARKICTVTEPFGDHLPAFVIYERP